MANVPYFVGDPRSGSLERWDHLDAGAGPTTSAEHPLGQTSPGIIRPTIAPDGRPAYQLTVTPESHASKASGSDAVWMWNEAKSYDGLGKPHASTWYHVRFYLPSAAYSPTTGDWNLLIEHHNDGGYKSFACSREDANLSLGIQTDFPVISGRVGVHPRLKLRIMGGPTCSPQASWYGLGRLKFDHWYDILYQVTWRSTTGRVNLWVDRREIVSYHGPTLYTRPDATISYTNLDLVNYRLHAPWSSTVYFGRIAIGPTRRSVGLP